MSLLLTWNRFDTLLIVFIVDIEQVNASWEACLGPCQTSGGAFLWKYQLPIFAKNHRGLTEF